MSRLFRGFMRGVTTDFRQQFQVPTKSIVGSLCTRYWEKQNRPLIERVVSKANLNPDSKVLEIGYGRGYGLSLCHKIVSEGNGVAFGCEISPYMIENATKKFLLEIMEDKTIALDRISVLLNMPYPNELMDAIYHVDVFYFWKFSEMQEICREFYRILKPGARLVCGMELNKLRRFEKYGIVRSEQFDPMQYMMHLEPSGFHNVKIEYENIEPNREVQIITADKPTTDEFHDDPDAQMDKLEKDIKQYLAMESLLQSQQANPDLAKQASKESDPTKKPQQESKPEPKPHDSSTRNK